MEQHPIPQDVTGFQFKLIGTMTVKQFGYVALGAILAVVCWYAPVEGFFWNFVAKGVLLPLFAILGVVIAFVPIEGRPVDVMATNFFHAMISPNQYIYKKRGRKFSFTQITISKPQSTNTQPTTHSQNTYASESKKEQQLRALLSRSYQDSKSNIDKKEMEFLKSFKPVHQAISTQPTHPASKQNLPPKPTPVLRTVAIPYSPTNPNAPTSRSPQKPQTSGQNASEIQKQINNTNEEKKQVEKEISELQSELKTTKSTNTTPPIQKPTTQGITPAQNIPQNMTKKAGFSHVSDTPNVVIGIVKDSRDNILPNILVEIKNSEGNPVRAFKTNPLGQFASATPLSNGDYTIELEDPKKLHVFDIIKIAAKGEIMLPIEITSHDAREELRKQLFN